MSAFWKWLFGCWHDWEVVEGTTRDNLLHKLKCEAACRYLPHGPDRNEYLHKKVCLKCGLIVDEIAAATAQYQDRQRDLNARQKQARAMLDMPPAKPSFSERPPLPPPPPPKRYA